MADYDFSTLNSTDLEELVCDLLNATERGKSAIHFRTFKEGKDRGIDILYSTRINQYQIVGQVKHYYRTGYEGMYNKLINEELKKVKILNPGKYIFATSVDLSVLNSQAIATLFCPYIESLNDIYGKKDLNRLLEENEQILSSHYKLWFSDTSVLKKLLNVEFEFRSSIFEVNELKKRLRLYVEIPLFNKARDFLKENKFIIICGEPGVGKTTLAEMLIYEYIKDDYKFTYILDDIKEADKVLSNDEEKHILYFDDFLGSNAIEINKAKGSETSLRKILRRISSQTNKLIVFTTRSFLLNSAIAESENLNRFNIKAKQSILKLSEYSRGIKIQILHNHIEESGLNEELKIVIKAKEISEFIISHDNFTPRSVEFITTSEIVNEFNQTEYKNFIYSSFNSSINIWEHAYSEQINENDRLLLNTLLTFGESTFISDLEKAFHYRLKYECETNNKTKEIQAFSKSLKRLEDGFIVIKRNEIHFINPSLIDFLLVYLRKDADEIERMINSICLVKQLTERFYSISFTENRSFPKQLENRILLDYYSFVSNDNVSQDLIKLCLFMFKYFKNQEAEILICEILQEIEDWDSLYDDYNLNFHFREFIEAVQTNSLIYNILTERSIDIITDLALGEDDISEAIKIVEELSSKYKTSIDSSNSTSLVEHFTELITNYIDQETDWLQEFISDESEALEKKKEIEVLSDRINKLGLKIQFDLREFDANDWFEISMDNEFRRLMEKDD